MLCLQKKGKQYLCSFILQLQFKNLFHRTGLTVELSFKKIKNKANIAGLSVCSAWFHSSVTRQELSNCLASLFPPWASQPLYYHFLKLLVLTLHFYHVDNASIYQLWALFQSAVSVPHRLLNPFFMLIERMPKLMKLHIMFSLLPCTEADWHTDGRVIMDPIDLVARVALLHIWLVGFVSCVFFACLLTHTQ